MRYTGFQAYVSVLCRDQHGEVDVFVQISLTFLYFNDEAEPLDVVLGECDVSVSGNLALGSLIDFYTVEDRKSELIDWSNEVEMRVLLG